MCADVVLPGLADIEAAATRVNRLLAPTPTLFACDLSESLGYPLWLKAENLQPTGSFKVRGAWNWLATANEDELTHGLITVSAGNHALALAWAAAQYQTSVTVVMPEGSSPVKIQKTERLGAQVIIHGTIQQAVALCHKLQKERGLTLVHPYDDPRIMAGQGTVALELLQQAADIERIIVPVGGGGLISGIGLAVKALRPDIEIVGVEPEGAATLCNAWQKQSAEAGLEKITTIAVSLGPARVGAYTYRARRQVVDTLVAVDDRTIIDATLRLLTEGRLYAETGAGTALAALLSNQLEPGKPTALVITGGNMDIEQVAVLSNAAKRFG